MTEPGPTQRAVLQAIAPGTRTGAASAETIAVRIDEAARISGLHPGTVRRLIDAGELPAVKVGRYRLIRVEALKTYLRNLEFKQLNAKRAGKENAGPLT